MSILRASREWESDMTRRGGEGVRDHSHDRFGKEQVSSFLDRRPYGG
jgi:hypothetical protein